MYLLCPNHVWSLDNMGKYRHIKATSFLLWGIWTHTGRVPCLKCCWAFLLPNQEGKLRGCQDDFQCFLKDNNSKSPACLTASGLTFLRRDVHGLGITIVCSLLQSLNIDREMKQVWAKLCDTWSWIGTLGTLVRKYKYLRGGYKEDRNGLFVRDALWQRQWTQHETQEVHSEYQETLFTVMEAEHWHRLTGCGVSILLDI